MLNIYLDSNIISYLQYPENYTKMAGDNSISIVKAYLDNLIYPVSVLYSPAHLMDSRKQFGKTPALALAKLEFISQLTKNTCLLQDIYTKEIRIEVRNATGLFSAYNDLHKVSVELGNRTKIATLVEDSGLFEAYKKAEVNYLEVAHCFKDLPISFRRTKESPNVFSLMCDLAEQFDPLFTDGHSLYKILRDKMQFDTAITDKLVGQKNPLTVADQLLPETETGQLMQDVMTDSFRLAPDNREDLIASLFMNLDSLGYRQDKLRPGHGYMSVATDAQHAFYASYCDIFVTQDERTADKAKAVYEYLQLPTKVVNLNELAALVQESSL